MPLAAKHSTSPPSPQPTSRTREPRGTQSAMTASKPRHQRSSATSAGEEPCELGPGLDAELGVDAGEVRLDGFDRHEEQRRDVLVRTAFGDELGDAPLRRRQHVARRRPAAAPPALGAAPAGPPRRAQLLRDRDRGLPRPPPRTSLLPPSPAAPASAPPSPPLARHAP